MTHDAVSMTHNAQDVLNMAQAVLKHDARCTKHDTQCIKRGTRCIKHGTRCPKQTRNTMYSNPPRDEPLPAVLHQHVHPLLLGVQHVHRLAALHVQLVVRAGREVVQDGHAGLGTEAVLLLQSHSHQGVHAGAAGDAPQVGLLLFCKAVQFSSVQFKICLLYTSPSPRDDNRSRMPSSA